MESCSATSSSGGINIVAVALAQAITYFNFSKASLLLVVVTSVLTGGLDKRLMATNERDFCLMYWSGLHCRFSLQAQQWALLLGRAQVSYETLKLYQVGHEAFFLKLGVEDSS